MREIIVRFTKRCAQCEDWVVVDKPAIYDDATKRIWHPQCDPRKDKTEEATTRETQEQLAERLGFR